MKSLIFWCAIIVSILAHAADDSGLETLAKKHKKTKHLTHSTTKIDNVMIWEAPYQVSIQRDSGHFCGGTILSDRYVITAARCVHNTSGGGQLTVHAGISDLSKVGQKVSVSRVNVHAKYSPETYNHDLAILVVAPRLKLGKYSVRAVRLLNGEPELNLTDVSLTGWRDSDYLHQQKFHIVNWLDKCKNVYSSYKVDEGWFCADLCVGQPGDPVLGTNRTKDGVLYGITSFEQGQCNSSTSAIYTSLGDPVNRKFVKSITEL